MAQARGIMDAVAVTFCILQIIVLCYITEPVHAQDGTIANINVTADQPVVLVRPRRNAGLRCTFSPSYPESAEVYWRKDDGTRLTEGRTSVFNRRRFRARTTRNRNFYGLLIRNVVPSEAGMYFCGVQLNGIVKEARVNLTVVVLESERGNASITARYDQVEGQVGGLAGMSCTYRPRYPQHVQFYWRKEDGTRVATGASAVYESDRISVNMRTYSPSYALFIRNLEPSDGGIYICGFEQNGRVVEARTTLRILMHPQILQNESSSYSVTARRGSDIDIRCIATGTPTPNITWTAVSHYERPDSGEPLETVIGHGPILTLHNMRRSDISYYQCLADNGIPPTASKVFFVQINGPPVVSVPNPTVVGLHGDPVLLRCDIISRPMAQSNWIFEGQRVTNSSMHMLLVNYRRDDEFSLNLLIREMSDNDLGQYSCQASNSLGNASRTINLVGNPGP